MNTKLAKSIRALLGTTALAATVPQAAAIEVSPLGTLGAEGLSRTGSVPKYAWDGNNNFADVKDLGWAHNSQWLSFSLPETASVRIAMTAPAAGMNPAFSLWSYGGTPDWSGVSFHGYNQIAAPAAGNSNSPMLPAVSGFVGYANSGPRGWANGDGDLIGDGSAPEGSGHVAELNSGSAELRLHDLPAGNYLAVLGGSCHSADCSPANTDYSFTVTLEVPEPVNAPPVADAGADATMQAEAVYVLDGSGSSDADGDTLAFQWTQVAGPEVVLSDPTAARPSFTAPLAAAGQTLGFELVVFDGQAESNPDAVVLRVAERQPPNAVPVADAGADGSIRAGGVYALDGSGSFDTDAGDSLTYIWTQIAGPEVSLSDPSAAQPFFTVPLAAAGQSLDFELLVSDGKAESTPDPVSVRVVQNSLPTLVLASPQPTVVDEGSPVTLHATAQDGDGDSLAFEWKQVSGSGLTLSGADSPDLSFTAPAVPPGGADFGFTLTVSDQFGIEPATASATATVHVRDALDFLDCSHAQASRTLLWPPSRTMIPVKIGNITGPGAFDLRIASVTQDEPVLNRKAGDATRRDAKIFTPKATRKDPQPQEAVLLRAERQVGKKAGAGNGRIYTVKFTATDGSSSCEGSVQVAVPPKKREMAVDDGQQFDSTAKN